MMKDNIQFIGLDFETSTGDTRTLAPIQLGMVLENPYSEDGIEEFNSYIGGWDWGPDSKVRWSEESQKVHNITQDDLGAAPPIFAVDIFASAWMLERVAAPRMNRIAVGWNVGSFDRRIVNDWFPNLDQLLSYRTLDLNTVCFYVADLLDMSYEKLKKDLKAEAAGRLGQDNWHDALFDAKAGLLNYYSLLDKVPYAEVVKYTK